MAVNSRHSSEMKYPFQDQVLGIPITSSLEYFTDPDNQCHISGPANGFPPLKQSKADSMVRKLNKLRKRADNFVNRIREHVRFGRKINVKGKLSLGAKILQVGGLERIFGPLFVVSEDEKLLNVFQCYLSTTAGKIAGLLFISTIKVAFCSERAIKFSSPNGKPARLPYKVTIPLRKVKRVEQSVNTKQLSEKYLTVVTVDNFDFGLRVSST